MFIRVIVLVISFSAYVVNRPYFLVKCFLVSTFNLVAFFIFLYQYVQTFHVGFPQCLPRILRNIGSVYVTRFAKTWLYRNLFHIPLPSLVTELNFVFVIVTFIYLFSTESFKNCIVDAGVDRLSWVSHWLLTNPPSPKKAFYNFP